MNIVIENCPMCREPIQHVSPNLFMENEITEDYNKRERYILDSMLFYYSNKQTDKIGKTIIEFYNREKKYECMICMCKLNDPINLSCGHILCTECSKYVRISDKFNIETLNKKSELLDRRSELLLIINENLCQSNKDLMNNNTYLKNDLEKEKNISNRLNSLIRMRESDVRRVQHEYTRKNDCLKSANRKIIRLEKENKEIKHQLNNRVNYIPVSHIKQIPVPLQNNTYVSEKIKRTRLCKYWLEGICKNCDNECKFAHGKKFIGTIWNG